ncbi:unnamed protein product [Didymodactylos carnosus]|uniref:Uncharacterized protein n=1 Tax=Didymodactylos carnosus TaxID=1234261 RepID=A0A814AG26_9BILA|nr:unnamed protein product [Didymodactylos carnosus]CAF1310392.1 unnamed protein product [Didymodactylos carnosus]CAF3694516.1 unnamed protein product [Didymodactylos carnosus]CAF4118200.1 unnamed protein product [Didymodactylos carnosus]
MSTAKDIKLPLGDDRTTYGQQGQRNTMQSNGGSGTNQQQVTVEANNADKDEGEDEEQNVDDEQEETKNLKSLHKVTMLISFLMD